MGAVGEAGHVGIAELLLCHGADLNLADRRGWKALHYAAAWGRAECARFLLAQPAIDVNATDIDGVTALIVASRRGRAKIVSLLLSQPGIDLNIACRHVKHGTALDVAKSPVVRDLLIQAGAKLRSDVSGQ